MSEWDQLRALHERQMRLYGNAIVIASFALGMACGVFFGYVAARVLI